MPIEILYIPLILLGVAIATILLAPIIMHFANRYWEWMWSRGWDN